MQHHRLAAELAARRTVAPLTRAAVRRIRRSLDHAARQIAAARRLLAAIR